MNKLYNDRKRHNIYCRIYWQSKNVTLAGLYIKNEEKYMDEKREREIDKRHA